MLDQNRSGQQTMVRLWSSDVDVEHQHHEEENLAGRVLLDLMADCLALLCLLVRAEVHCMKVVCLESEEAISPDDLCGSRQHRISTSADWTCQGDAQPTELARELMQPGSGPWACRIAVCFSGC